MRLFAVFILLFTPFTSNGAERNSNVRKFCSQHFAIFQEASYQLRFGVLDGREKQRLKKLFTTGTKSNAELEKVLFDTVLKARIRKLPEEVQQTVRETIKKRIKFFQGKGTGSVYMRGKDKDLIIIDLPRRLQNTAIHYSTLMHEIEHAVHDHIRYSREVKSEKELPSKVRKYASHYLHFLNEKNAIMAEWNYIHHLTPELRAEAKRLVEQSEDLDPKMKEMFVRNFEAGTQ